jgi:hypothetical protein
VLSAVVAAALLFWVCVFGIYFTAQGISPADFFFGAFVPHDPELARWRAISTDPASGLVREERLLLPEGNPTSRYLERQVRHRDPATERVVLVEPPSKVRRERARSIRP